MSSLFYLNLEWMFFLKCLFYKISPLNNDSFKVIYFALNWNLESGNFRWVPLSVNYMGLCLLLLHSSLIPDMSHICDSYLFYVGI